MGNNDIIQALERVRYDLDRIQIYAVPDPSKATPPHIANDLIIIERLAEKALQSFPALLEAVKELQAVLEERATQVSALAKALEYQQAKLDAALAEPCEAEICIVANGLFRGIKPYEQAKASLTNFIKGRRGE